MAYDGLGLERDVESVLTEAVSFFGLSLIYRYGGRDLGAKCFEHDMINPNRESIKKDEGDRLL